MQFATFFVVLVAFLGRISLSRIVIEPSKRNGLTEVLDAVTKISTNCYANRDKTILLLGDPPGNLVQRLTAHQSFALVLLDKTRRTMNNADYTRGKNENSLYPVYIVILMASNSKDMVRLQALNLQTPYFTSRASYLILRWSPENKYADCGFQYAAVDSLLKQNRNEVLNVNLICRDRNRRTLIYTSNPFTNLAPEPWQLVDILPLGKFRHFSFYVREYRESEEMCKNLDFDKTRDLGHTPITTVLHIFAGIKENEDQLKSARSRSRNKKQFTSLESSINYMNAAERRRSTIEGMEEDVNIEYFGGQRSSLKRLVEESEVIELRNAHMWIENDKSWNMYYQFLIHVNAINHVVRIPRIIGKSMRSYANAYIAEPRIFAGDSSRIFTYPHGTMCQFTMTQFRGNKSQLRKIFEVIDIYSWYGIGMTSFITLIFFKIFLGHPLLKGLLNLFRLSCNVGLLTVPRDTPSRVYLGCLFFFLVTMNGIFISNLAALLTHDIPVRQVNSIRDLAELNYTIYVSKTDSTMFRDPIFEGRIVLLKPNEPCWMHVRRAPWNACVTMGARSMNFALNNTLHVSSGCINTIYIWNQIPFQWALQEKMNTALGIMTAGGFIASLKGIVMERRLLEYESQEIPDEPRVMTFKDVNFAFVILGIGLGFASIAFISEIIVYRWHHRVRRTRVIVL